MKPIRPLLLAVLCALASACASTGSHPAAAPAAAESTVIAAPVADAAPPEPAATVASEVPAPTVDAAPATDAQPAAEAGQASAAETDFDAIYGNTDASGEAEPGLAPATAYDPWEKYNRHVHAFNSAMDRHLAKPLAQAYVAVVPRPVRTGVSNFFDNLGQPVTLVNSLLQGNPRGAANALGRFLLNSTLGVGGLFDVAAKAKMPKRGEDFGQTLAVWGWKRSRYLELPFLGPRTVRDLLGLGADSQLQPLHYLEDDKARVFLQGLQLVDLRTRLLALESLGEGAVDEYALYRDVWLQRRNYQINQTVQSKNKDKAKQPDADLPAYLLEDVPATPTPTPTP